MKIYIHAQEVEIINISNVYFRSTPSKIYNSYQDPNQRSIIKPFTSRNFTYTNWI